MTQRKQWPSPLATAKRDRKIRALVADETRRLRARSEENLSERCESVLRDLKKQHPSLISHSHQIGSVVRSLHHLETDEGVFLVSLSVSCSGVSWSIRGNIDALLAQGLHDPYSACPAVFDYELRGSRIVRPRSGVATLASSFCSVSSQYHALKTIETLLSKGR